MPVVSLCPVERSADLINEGLSTLHTHARHQEKIIKELREQLKLSEDKVKELQKEKDDYDDLVPDGVEGETFDWIEDRLAKADVMEEELAKYEEDPEKLCATMDDHVENYLDDQGISLSLEELCEAYNDLTTSLQTTENYWKSKFEAVEQSTESSAYQEEEIKRLQANNKGLTILKQEAESRSFCYEAENKELIKENKKLKEETISREEHQKIADFLNAEAEKYKVKFMEATGQLK